MMRHLATLTAVTWACILPAADPVPSARDALERDFLSPPTAALPHVWWHWVGNNVTRDGITRDLEAMKAAGIGGATTFHIASQAGFQPTSNSFTPEVAYHNDAWWELLRHAAAEAHRLGLELGMHNCPGFSVSGGPWIKPEQAMQQVVWSEVAVTGPTAFAKPLVQPKDTSKLGHYRDIAVLAVPDGEPAAGKVLDLSAQMTPDGAFTWQVPEGKWTLFRMGHACTGARTRPAPADIQEASLEADKLSAEAMTLHLEQVMKPLKRHLGGLVGTAFKHLLLDSYEAGPQNWTPRFRETFIRLRGYDPVPRLPVLAKRLIGGKAQAERFQEDMDRTVKDLFNECHFALFRTWTRDHGLVLQLEPYGGPFDEHEAAAYADLPMREFWSPPPFWTKVVGGEPEVAGAVGRAMGRHIIATEAFTGMPRTATWCEAPRHFKNAADATFARGINRMTLHHWVHQPFGPELKPGMTMGPWGSHFGQNQTWHEPGKAFYRYLGTCQALLQRGEQVVDVLALNGRPRAHEMDAIPTSVFLRDLTVGADGRVALPSGRTYAILRLPDGWAMSLEVARKVEALLQTGATLWGKRPGRTWGLVGFPACDQELAAIADRIWGTDATATEHRVGKGRIVWSKDAKVTADTVLAASGQKPGLILIGNDDGQVLGGHRQDGGTPYFFIANIAGTARTITASFRVAGMVPELWHPDTHERTIAGGWQERDGRTELPLALGPNQAFFVVFRQPDIALKTMPATPAGQETAITVAGPWRVAFDPRWGGPHQPVAMETLASWSVSPDPGTRHYSGTATYTAAVDIPAASTASGRRVAIDLGEVREIAAVTVNGRAMGVAWYEPFVLDITGAVQAGRNTLTIAVTNTWQNRLVGDAQEPDDCHWGEQRMQKDKKTGEMFLGGCTLLEYPDWILQRQPRPAKGRYAFSVWNYFNKESALQPAGLLGPVRIVCR